MVSRKTSSDSWVSTGRRRMKADWRVLQRPARLACFGVFAATALAACGAYEWPNREVTVPPRHFVVNEAPLLDVSASGKGCSAPMFTIRLADSCKEECGPMRISKEGKDLGRLLAPEMRRPSTVDPGRVERPYAVEPLDGSRRTIAIPTDGDADKPYTIEARCGIKGKTSGGEGTVKPSGSNKVLISAPAACSLVVEVSCS